MSLKPVNNFDLPRFSLSDAEFWFNSVELILQTGAFCDHHLYDSVKEHLEDVNYRFLMCGMPEPSDDDEDKYPQLRKFVLEKLEEYGLTDIVNSVALFSCRDLKPSAFLNILNQCFGEFIPKSMKRTFWLARLPRKIQKVVFAAILLDLRPLEDRTLESLAEEADGIAAYEKYHSFPSVKKLKISLPQYVLHDPELWFYSLDEAFSLHGVTEEQLRFEHTMNALHSEEILTAALFLTDLPNEPTKNKYTNLRERIIKTFNVIKNDPLYSFVFRNAKGLKPRPLLQFLNNLAAKTGIIIPQLLIRTFWIMQLPVRTQAMLYQLWTASPEPLQDLDIEAMALVAENLTDSNEPMRTIRGKFSAPKLNTTGVVAQAFLPELQSATSFQQKISLGKWYCDLMYRTYYRNNPSESEEKCTTIRRVRDTTVHVDTDAKRNFFEGCTCWYHDHYGEFAVNCTQILQERKLDL